MFTVFNKITDQHCVVYGVRTDKKGYPYFLIYDDPQWVWMSAKHFVPIILE